MVSVSLDKFRSADLPSEDEIRASWDLKRPLVSVVCMSYNHENYIDDAIRGFLIQKTDFPFEIILHDDCSTDGTAKKLKDYASKYPNVVRLVLQDENRYSKGVKILLLAASYASGEFVAFCEGDDFWISSEKLQTQVSAMGEFPSTEICFHSSVVVQGEGVNRRLFCKRANVNTLFGVSPIIRCGGSFMPTASMLIRRSFFERAFSDKSGFFGRYFMGYCCQIFCSLAGGALYIDRPMAVYRSLSEGSWTQAVTKNMDFYMQWLASHLGMLKSADAITSLKYHDDFAYAIRKCHFGVLNNTSLDIEYRRRYFHANRIEMGWVGVVLWFGVYAFRPAHVWLKRMKSLVRTL